MGIFQDGTNVKPNDTSATTIFLEKYPERIEIDRPEWSEVFLKIAIEVSKRSHDAQTKHGCVITTLDHRIIGTGYNGFPRGLPDNLLPNTRPAKYPICVHSEPNCILNCSVSPILLDGINVYVTGIPCIQCLCLLINAGAKNIWYIEGRGWSKTEEEKVYFDFLVEQSGIKLHGCEIDMV